MRSFLALVIIFALVSGGALLTFGVVVHPGEMGVRQIRLDLEAGPIKLGPPQGFSKSGLKPGLHWNIPFYSTIHIVPSTLQSLHFDRDKKVFADTLGSLDIQTADGTTVDVDVSILTRVYDNPGQTEEGKPHGGPEDLIQRVGISPESWNLNIRQIAEDELRRALGSISSGDFYNPFKREEEVALASKKMNERLASFGIKVEAVLLRRYTYRATRIDNAIFQKNLQDQEERLNEAASKFAEARAKLDQVEAEWDARIQTLQVTGENDSKVLRSEADLYESKKTAEGDLLIAKAKAEVDRLRSQALAQAGGSEVYVARELAPILGSLKGGVVENMDPYDLSEWLKKLGIQ